MKTTEPTSLDMLELARFAVLPGANRLIQAFGQIPPGPLRESVIQHAEVIAQTYASAPASSRMPDPIGGFVQGPQPKQIAVTRTGRAPPTGDPHTLAVKMRIDGKTTEQIQEKTGLSVSAIYGAISEARKAGLKVPRGHGKPVTVGSKRWAYTMDDLSGQGQVQVELAGRKRGISGVEYLERRQLALKLAQGGASYETILKETGERDAKVVSAWLSAARGAGIEVPYVVFLNPGESGKPWQAPEPESEPVQDTPVMPVGRVFLDLDAMGQGQATMVRKAAERRNMTVAAYQDMRESIVRHRMDGRTYVEIMAVTGEGRQMIKDTLDAAQVRGVSFPPYVQAVEVVAIRG